MVRSACTPFALLALLSLLAGSAAVGTAIASGVGVDEAGRYDLLALSPSAASGSIGGFVNPAAWAMSSSSDVSIWWSDRSWREDVLDSWGISSSGVLGSSFERRAFLTPDGLRRVYDGRVGIAHGDRGHAGGIAWVWSTGDKEEAGRENGLVLGAVERPNRYLSWGASGFLSTESDRRVGIGDVAIRPLGTPRLTLFGDYALRDDQRPADGVWSAGAEFRPLSGLHVGARIREAPGGEDLQTVFHVGVTLGATGFSVLPSYDEDGERGTTTYLLRGSPPYRGLPVEEWAARTFGPKRWEPINLENKRIRYQKDRWFDDGTVAWIDLARHIRAVREDPSVAGIVLNLTDASIPLSVRWELRTELARCREAGKKVAVHLNGAGMGGAYLASVADRVTMDPQGEIMLMGVAMRRTYLKGSLEKLGVGFEELRYFEYKSANESYARSDMSPADREQRARIVDVLYEELRHGVCAGRGIEPEEYDRLVEEELFLSPKDALEVGLVDSVGRWNDLTKWISESEGGRIGRRVRGRGGRYPDERWGRPPTVAVVYAQGVCAMDEGIRGRATSKAMRGFSKRRDVAAVVLRADSPGGRALPSDLIAKATRTLREKEKPVIVSQGGMAASGGYWISMDGERILTTPLTVTGSIGVIGGWMWNDGLAERAGLTVDGVQRGAHADLLTGVRFPLVGVRLPERPLDDPERELFRDRILDHYDDFVARVAEGRGMKEDDVREIAEGRVWMGGDAVARGLCDDIGTLLDAVDEARVRAGIAPDEEVRLEEYPKRRLFRFPDLFPSFPGLSVLGRGLLGGRDDDATAGPVPAGDDYPTLYLKALATHPGAPMVLTDPDLVPVGVGER